MNADLGRAESQKILGMRRCYEEGRKIEWLFSTIDRARAAIRKGTARPAGNILSEMVWAPIAKIGIPADARAFKREIKALHEMMREPSNRLEKFSGIQKYALFDKLNRVHEAVYKMADQAKASCGGPTPLAKDGAWRRPMPGARRTRRER